MAVSYDPTALDQPLNETRLLLGDTDTSDAEFADEELERFLSLESDNTHRAAARGAEALAAKYAGSAQSKSADGRSISHNRFAHYRDLAKSLRAQAKRAGARPYAGGISKAGKEAAEEDEDRSDPTFSRGMHDDAQQLEQRDLAR